MRNIKNVLVSILLVFVAVLAGCGDDKPGDKLASETIHKVAETDLSEGLEIANFKRSNGQIDGDSPNRYKVVYSYDLRLVKPFAEVVLENAKAIKNEIDSNAKKAGSGFFDVNSMQNRLQAMELSMGTSKWIQDQEGEFPKRRDNFLGSCRPCVDYWNSEEAPKDAGLRRQAFISSWSYFEGLGFKDESKLGDSIPRNAWAYFSKTEKGWQSAN